MDKRYKWTYEKVKENLHFHSIPEGDTITPNSLNDNLPSCCFHMISIYYYIKSVNSPCGWAYANNCCKILNNFPTAGKHYHRKSNFWR